VLAEKGTSPDVLIMSATPIPRTLSLILYGDVEVSIIDELPAGRKPIKTHYIPPKKYGGMYTFIRDEIKDGRQAYFVCPLVEDSEVLDIESAQSLHERLSNEVFPNLRVGLVHGRLKAQEKDCVMRAFAAGELDILVSTTVIEVGINVPNASIMVIQNTERFGLSQLHQLRGRVGRGQWQSYCFLTSEKPGKIAKERIKTLVGTNDGFEIADKDLELRGPGELLGIRQHGIPELRLANLSVHGTILEAAQSAAINVMRQYARGGDDTVERIVKSVTDNLFKDFSI
jgi:ATP-dependent DNA helicase RecG